MHDADCAIDQRQRQPQHDKTVGQGLAGEADVLADVEHQRQEDQAEGDDDGGVHGGLCLQMCAAIEAAIASRLAPTKITASSVGASLLAIGSLRYLSEHS
ncbi:hypothetical protein D3C71_1730830 [compost metagenome]